MTEQRFAAALSEHPLPTHAAGEVIGAVLERLGDGPAPDLAVLFVTAPHAGAMEDIAGAVRKVLEPATLIGCTAVSVVGGAREVEEQPAVSLWVARLNGSVEPVRIESYVPGVGTPMSGLRPGDPRATGTLVLLADPFSVPVDDFLGDVPDTFPGLTVAGGLASAARGPGGNRLVLNDVVYTDGAVGALLPSDIATATVVSQGCRPIGDPMTVTKSERQIIYELAGKPALERLAELIESLDPDERALASHGIHLGRVIDEHREVFDRGDFLIRNVIGGDRQIGAIAVGDEVELGATVQFQVRDAISADEDLRLLLTGRRAEGALVFTCNGRGTHLFGAPDHDAQVIDAHVDDGATAGMFCAGELGPIGGRSFLHGFTASIVLFGGTSP